MRRLPSYLGAALAALALLPLSAGGERAWVGLWTAPETGVGLRVVAIYPGGPAERAGLQVGDVLVTAGGVDLARAGTLGPALESRRPGETIELTVARGEGVRELSLVLGKSDDLVRDLAPADVPAPRFLGDHAFGATGYPVQWALRESRWIGVDLVDLTPELRRHYGAEPDAGVLITRVDDPGLGREMGLRVGDVVIAIEDRPVRAVSDFDRRIAWYDEKRVTLTIVRDRERRRVDEPEGARRRLVVDRQRAWRERRIREQIESLERRLESLRHQLERLDAERDPSPDG